MVVNKRVYVGNLINDPQGCLDALKDRLTKFGKSLDDFENHGSFAYMDMSFDDESHFIKLKNSFNRLKFKGNDLRVDAAKPCWQWEIQKKNDDKEEVLKEKRIAEGHWKYHKKIENVNTSWEDRMQVIPGRQRRTSRNKQQLRNITFRVDVNGSLKVYKCYKNKLWGYERHKELQDLVFKFSHGQWRNGWDHIVDRLNYSRAKVACRHPILADDDDEEEEEEEADEKATSEKVLADMLESFDFDRAPVDSEEDNELVDEWKHKDEKKVKASGQPDEPVPFFDKPASQTETLRNLFDPQGNQPFKLAAEADADIDHDKDVPKEEEVNAVIETVGPLVSHEKNTALFFPHFDSPFLSGQTQLSKLQGIQPNLDSWQQEFWNNRAPWMRDMKRKKRDALRQLAKRKARNGAGLLV
ncbi:BN860_04324g1_1 [Zygosaccharomyces bailii CLIB 213]|uniref:BN860_04324g1_1 n=1 Tax=Zygosaccharomyces bailii (strain CLIB 213 / ATCC 58445 / CBS 680 / BCRC 21525 / NBRC 1098 / NCYC 1416 / NRRL Y-2227) TaxID=1333698 RepID=A0A8J2X7Z4_ZYGB2|nr:BN860_04324g1_1 [Zygosaccharomyces bailii CLIB 213]